jgi:hypothetical protein
VSAVRGTELVQRLTYQYDANGTVRERHDHLAASFPEVLEYDELNRLKERRQQQSAGADLVDKGHGDLVLRFGSNSLRICDSNSAYESYTIGRAGFQVVV